MSDNQRVIKSYVWHGEDCFFVSTIERDSSAAADPGRYNETIVWRYDWDKGKTAAMIYQRDCVRRSIGQHLKICQELFDTGELKPEET